LGGLQATKGDPSTKLLPKEAANLFGEPADICIISRATGLIRTLSDTIKIWKGSGGVFESTGNEFVSKIRMNYSNISEYDPFSVQDQNSGPPK
jgi:hypothetical protein